VGKSQIIRKIHSAAINYKSYFVGNTYDAKEKINVGNNV